MVLDYNEWQKTMPQWLKDSQADLESGNVNDALKILDESQVQKKLKSVKSKEDKIFIKYAVAKQLFKIGHLEGSEKFYKQILDYFHSACVFNELAFICEHYGRYTEAVNYLYKAMKLSPDEPKIWSNLGSSLMKIGQAEKGIGLLRKAIDNHNLTDNCSAHQNLLINLHYLPDIQVSTIYEESKKWAKKHAPAHLAFSNHNNVLNSEKKLKIGYISPDFRIHSVAYFFEPLLDGHNRDQFEIYGYGNVEVPDSTTKRMIKKFDSYCNISKTNDKEVADIIKKDGIDILVDLAGHAGKSRVAVLAYKPAPIQVTYLGYPNTTGMTQVDYRLTDAIVDTDEQQKFYTEELVFLPNGFLCYGPGDEQPPFTPLPALENGYITFGSFNNSSKINPYIMKIWADILKAVPDSKLLLKFKAGKDQQVKDYYWGLFKDLGIGNEQIVISGWLPSPKHLELYNHIDIALDTYPYNGTTITCQALLMGVPTLTLAGRHHASRVGLSILSRLDMEFFAAKTPEEYVKKAVALAAKPDALANIRATMRHRLISSSLCNYKLIAGDIENAYRQMWKQYCHSRVTKKIKERFEPAKDKQQKPKVMENHDSENTKTFSKISKSNQQQNCGIFYAIWGNSEKIENSLKRSIQSVKKYHPYLPIHVERFEKENKINKTRMCDISPFEVTAFLDNDTVVLGKLDYGFQKAQQFGLACCINVNPWARRYSDERLHGDMVEYSSGVLFFTKKAKPVFNAWSDFFADVDASILLMRDEQLCYFPVADQGSFALAIQKIGFNPFILPHNWNFSPRFHTHFFGPIKIWHGYDEIPKVLLDWNVEQSAENAVIKYGEVTKQLV
ncbi:hypothetical protein ES703_33840 [subsurface metagenome]